MLLFVNTIMSYIISYFLVLVNFFAVQQPLNKQGVIWVENA